MSVLLAVSSCKANLARQQVEADGLVSEACLLLKVFSSLLGSRIEALWCLGARLGGFGLGAPLCGRVAGG